MSYTFVMRHSYQKRHRHHSRGFSILYAVALLIIVALLAGFLLNIVSTGQKVSSTEVLSTKALYAAESGAQIAGASLYPVSGVVANCSAVPTNITFTSAGLLGCQSAVSCTEQTSSGRSLYNIRSVGSCGPGGLDQGQRTVEVLLSQIE